MAIEEEFAVEIPDAEADEITSVGKGMFFFLFAFLFRLPFFLVCLYFWTGLVSFWGVSSLYYGFLGPLGILPLRFESVPFSLDLLLSSPPLFGLLPCATLCWFFSVLFDSL